MDSNPVGNTFGGFIRKWLTILFLVIIAGAGLYTWGTLKYVYSRGQRAGYVQKFSQKGWIFKTWEGELAMVNLPGSAPEKFYFTVRDKDVAEKFQTVIGGRATLSYDEHRGLPGSLFGDTPYWVTDVQSAADLGSGQPPSHAPATPAPTKAF